MCSTDDCNDNNSGIYPGAIEFCDFEDNDCDGVVDDNPVNSETWYYDGDGDNYGVDTITLSGCWFDKPNDYAYDDGDCNDAEFFINPGAFEQCDAQDNDCDNLIDEGQGVRAQSRWTRLDGPTWSAMRASGIHGAAGMGVRSFVRTTATSSW